MPLDFDGTVYGWCYTLRQAWHQSCSISAWGSPGRLAVQHSDTTEEMGAQQVRHRGVSAVLHQLLLFRLREVKAEQSNLIEHSSTLIMHMTVALHRAGGHTAATPPEQGAGIAFDERKVSKDHPTAQYLTRADKHCSAPVVLATQGILLTVHDPFQYATRESCLYHRVNASNKAVGEGLLLARHILQMQYRSSIRYRGRLK
mgnify:CR=1 FL=1